MLQLCSRELYPGEDRQLQIDTDEILPMDEKTRNHIMKMSKELNEDGLRISLQ